MNRKGAAQQIQENNRTKGFTLVELIVILAIIGIIMGGTATGIINYQKYAMYKRNNEYAQSIFIGAQATLAHYKASGELEDFYEEIQSLAKAHPDQAGTIRSQVGKTGEEKAKIDYLEESEKDRIYYLIINNGQFKGETYKDYTDEVHPLYRLLSNNIYDDTIAPASICVEFDPLDGVVKSVCYSDRAEKFTYEGWSQGKRGQVWKEGDSRVMDMEDRTEETRREIILGYYGAGIGEQAPISYGKPVIEEVVLDNGEVLDLRWKMKGENNSVTNFTYLVEIWQDDGNASKRKLSFTVNAAAGKPTGDGKGEEETNKLDKKGTLFEKRDHSIDCSITFYDNNGNETGQKAEIKFCAYADGDKTGHLILDAVDLSREYPKEEYKETIQDETYSIQRLKKHLDFTKKIYVKMQAIGNNYKPSSWKTSNSEDARFGKQKKETKDSTEKVVYEINTARHLYNIRYVEVGEGKEDPKKILNEFVQKKNINWGGENGTISNANVFKSQTVVGNPNPAVGDGWKWDRNKDGTWDSDDMKKISANLQEKEALFDELQAISFPALGTLHENHSFYAEGNCSIQNLIVRATRDLTARIIGKVGLFRENYGDIHDLKFENVYVYSGCKYINNFPVYYYYEYPYAGTVCGINMDTGKLNDIEVSSGYIDGGIRVGGIAGSAERGKEFSGLVNKADVQGYEEVGGIFGLARNVESIKNCKNTGLISASGMRYNCRPSGWDDAFLPMGPYPAIFAGGIAGSYVCDEVAKVGRVVECTSTIPLKLDEGKEISEEILEGEGIGGILGAAKNIAVENCTASGTIVGKAYIGGILGLGEDTTIKKCTNKADVIGKKYVGGITGVNGKGTIQIGELSKEEENIGNIGSITFSIEEGKIENGEVAPPQISDCTNKGLAIASGEEEILEEEEKKNLPGYVGVGYAGGIAGYNGGKISDSTSEIDTSSKGTELLEKAVKWGENAICVGGIAGYNDGTLNGQTHSTQEKEINSVAAGKNYVGGVVGYNNSGASIYSYRLEGGYIQGKNFVGGFIGLNRSQSLFSDGDPAMMEAKPNKVIGKKYVGGIIGGNIVTLKEDDSSKNLTISCKVNNFLGTIQEDQEKTGLCVGGFIGYNCLKKEMDAGKYEEFVGDLIKAGEEGKGDIDEVSVDRTKLAETKLTISGSGAEGESSSSELNEIKASRYVGGIVGYNEAGTTLVIENIINRAIIRATGSKEKKYIVPLKEDSPSLYQYSYAGGIIGIATPKVTLRNCKNAGNGEARGMGNFQGGLTEVNQGTIENCEVGSFGLESNDKTNYIGGIAGVNTGTISQCKIPSGVTVEGKDCVGGFAAINDKTMNDDGTISKGTISGSEISGTVMGTGNNIGGAAGVNRGIIQDGSLKSGAAITGTGTNVGGFCGTSDNILDLDVPALKNLKMKDVGRITVEGKMNIGGIAGSSKNSIQDCINYSEVTAAEGNAGGIVGKMETGDILSCENRKSIKATQSGNAGGITAENNSQIKNCVNVAEVIANNGDAGGIAGINAGTIVDCSQGKEQGKDDEKLNIQGIENIGGVTAINRGKIQDTKVQNIEINLLKTSGSAGGIAGKNEEGAEISSCAVKDSTFSSRVFGVQLGGITGTNMGKIEGGEGEGTTVSKVNVELNQNLSGWLGGICGINQGTVKNYSFQGLVTGQSGGNNSGYGGIAGKNENSDLNKKESGLIENCYVTGNSTVAAVGTDDDFANLGGIAGINRTHSSIRSCGLNPGESNAIYIGTTSDATSKNNAVCGDIGGIAGENDGEISSCEHVETPKKDGEINITEIKEKEDINSHKNKYDGTVYLYGRRGNIGGIAGLNNENGSVRYCSTGKHWKISVKESKADDAAGGIIGYSRSREKMSNLANYASVEKKAGGSQAGIIGRQETQTSNSWGLSKCINYGAVFGEARSGGIIGQWKYKGGMLQECINLAEIEANSNGCAGIVGFCFFSGQGETLTMNSCENYGGIRNGNGLAGGMVGGKNAGSNQKISLSFADCINAGYITGGNGSAGILADDNGYSTVNFIRCRNYGRGSAGDFSGIKGGSKETNRVLKDCIGVVAKNDIKYPITAPWKEKDNAGNIFISSEKEKDLGKGNPLSIREVSKNNWEASNGDLEIVIYGLPCDPNAEKSLSRAQINQFEEAFSNYYKERGEKLNDPTGVTVERTGESYKISWTSDPGARAYEVSAKLYKDKEGTEEWPISIAPITVAGDNQAKISVKDYVGKYIRFYVQAKGLENDKDSGRTKTAVYLIENAVPVPEVYLDLVKQGQTIGYQCVLKNKAAYSGYTEEELKNSQITVKIGGDEKKFSIENGRSANFNLGNTGDGGSSSIVTAYATVNKVDSESSSKNTYIYNINTLRDNKRATIANARLKGKTLNSLMCEVQISARNAFYRADAIVRDEAINSEVILSSGEVRITGDNTKDGTVLLSDLGLTSEDKEFAVRVYPYYSQEQMVMYAKPLNEAEYRTEEEWNENGYTAEELKRSPYWDKGKNAVKEGYAVERKENKYYVVLSSVYFDGSSEKPFAYAQTTVKLMSMEEAPVITSSPAEKDDQYVFSWDQKGGEGPYKVILTGFTLDGASVQLVNKETTDKTLSQEIETWKYSKAHLEVSRLGKTDANGYTLTLGGTAAADFDFKLPLDTISRPAISLKDGNKDELEYRITWSSLTKKEQLDHLAYYRVMITAPDDQETFFSTESDPQKTELVVSLEQWSGRGIRVSVQAIAKADAVYSDSKKGVVRDFNVPKRLGIRPENLKLLLKASGAEPAEAVNVEDYQNAFRISMKDDEAVGNGRYVLEAGIYEDNTQDANGAPTGRLLKDLSSQGRITMEGSLKAGFYDLENSGEISLKEYAGKWLGVRVRAVSDSSISSGWSAYQFLPLPKARLGFPQIAESEETQSYSVLINGENKGMNQDVINNALKWPAADDVDEYDLTLQRLKGAGETEAPAPLHVFIIKNSANGYDVSIGEKKDGKILGWQVGTLNASETSCILEAYSYDIVVHDAELNAAYTITAKAKVEYLSEEHTFQLVLPDNGIKTDKVGYFFDERRLITRSVEVLACSNQPEQYQDSLVREWVQIIRHDDETGNDEFSTGIYFNEGDIPNGWKILTEQIGMNDKEP